MRTFWGWCVRQPLAVGILLAMAVMPSHARDGTWYLGAGAGLLKANAKDSRLAQPRVTCIRAIGPGITVARPLACDRSADDSEFSVSLFGGYEYNKYFAVELGFADLPGSFDAKLTDPNFPAPSSIEVEQDSRALVLRSVLTLPMREFALPARLMRDVSISAVLGISRWRSETDLAIDLTGAGSFASTASNSANGFGLTFGARLGYDISEQIRVSLAWDRYLDLGDSETAVPRPIANPTLAPFRASPVNVVKDDVDVYSLNLMYRF